MSALAKRYALALDGTIGAKLSGQAFSELEALAGLVGQNPAFKRFLESPGIAWAEKEALLQEIEKRSGALPQVIKFFKLVVKNRRLKDFDSIVSAFRDVGDASAGVRRARLTSAKPLPPATAEHIRKRLGEILGTSLVLELGVNKELIGGIQLKVGSMVYDGSISSALKSLRSALLKGSA